MNLLLDTHAFLWFFLNDTRMAEAQRVRLRPSQNRIHLSAVSIFEILTKTRIGKLPQASVIASRLDHVYDDFDLLELPVTARHAAQAGRLPGHHRDPFDRLLAAQSLVEGMPIVTNDPAFEVFGAETVW